MSSELEQAALQIAQALTPQVDAAVAILATAKAGLDALVDNSPNVGSSRPMIIQASEVMRNYAHAIAKPLIDLGIDIDLSDFDPPSPESP